ncbi:MAG: hypothetical protein WBS19_03670 [Candidatus Korobacteraceae bacterium]
MPSSIGADTKLLIISHDCDLVSASYELEPFFEFLAMRPQTAEARDGRLFNKKNPRRLQFEAEHLGKLRLYEVNVHERYRVDRKVLESGSPDITIKIKESDVRMIAKWMGRRYDRPSLPTAFINRLTTNVKNKLPKKMQKDGEDVLDVLVGSENWGELAPGTPYKIVFYVLMGPEACENEQREKRGLSVVSDMRALLAQCDGIEVEDANLANTAELTLNDYQHLRRWDFDFLTPEQG